MAEGKCEDKAVAKTLRWQCAESCGVCKALEMSASPSYPKAGCTHGESGNDPAHAESCEAWAANGECVKNIGFMGSACEAACGLCEVGGARVATTTEIAAGGTKKKKKKKKKKVKAPAEGGEAVGGESAPAKEEAKDEAKAAPATEAAPAKVEAKTEAAKEDGKKKKKGWKAKVGDAMGAAFGKKKEKDEV